MAEGVPSLNDRALAVALEMAAKAPGLGVDLKLIAGARVIDAGVNAVGSIDAGLLMARTCMADLGSVAAAPGMIAGVPVPHIAVSVAHPVPACMASQYAGWQIKHEDFFAMGSGPFRAAYGSEKLYRDIGFTESPNVAVGILETASLPDPEVIYQICNKTDVTPERLTLIAAKTASLAGGVQVVARSVETAMHKLHEIGFDITHVVGGYGSAPLCPVAKDDMAAIGRTNDAILYGGQVTLMVTGDDDAIAKAGEQLPSNTSKDYGRPFAEIFKSYDYDFYKIDPLLFSPALVSLQNISTGSVFTFGQTNDDVLAASFFDR